MYTPQELKSEMANLYPVKEGFKVRLSDTQNCASPSKKWQASLLAGILFLIISAPLLYRFVDGLVKRVNPNLSICDEKGCPTNLGLVLHAVVFVLLTRLLMR